MNTLKRIAKHALSTKRTAGKAFPETVRKNIAEEIGAAEAEHFGEFRFAVDGPLTAKAIAAGVTARERALDVFSLLRMWDTEHRNGVLIYVSLADRIVEIVADRGINALAKPSDWVDACKKMRWYFGQNDFEKGAIEGVRAVNAVLKRHCPAHQGRGNELPNDVVML